MKKFIIFALGLLVFLFIGRQVLVPKMVERGFARMISANVGVDRTADLSDGLHVYICGAGSPLSDPKRSGPCIAVLAGLDWTEAKDVIDNDDWRDEAEANRAEMMNRGIWGVPSFRVGETITWGQDRLWVIEHALQKLTDT